MSLYKTPLVRIGLITIFFGIAAMILHRQYPHLYLPGVPVLISFFFGLYLLFVLLLLQKEHDHKPVRFINRFILLTGIKLFILLAFILIYLVLVKPQSTTLFLLYTLILYTGYSLATYSAILSPGKKK